MKSENNFVDPQVQRSSVIKSQITENVRSVLYANNTYRRKFLNEIGKIYKEWSSENQMAGLN